MQLMTTLKQQFRDFPMIQPSENQAFQSFCSKIIQSAALLQRVPKNFLKAEDINTLHQAHLFKILLPRIPNQQSFHFYQLLQLDTSQYSLDDEILISQCWSDYIENEMLSNNVERDLYPFYRLKSLFYTPAQITGLMIAFIKKGMPAIRIIETHLFKNFFDQYACEIHIIQNACEILKARKAEDQGIEQLLALLEQFSCGLSHYPNMSLDTQNHLTPPLLLPSMSIPKSSVYPKNIFNQFVFLFGNEWLADIILLEERDPLFVDFQHWLPQQSLETIQNIYQCLWHITPNEELLKTYTRVLFATPKSMIPKLYESMKDLFWILVALKPELLKQSKNQILKEAEHHPVSVKNQLFVAKACKLPKFEAMKDKLYFDLFHLQFQTEERQASIINDLYHHSHTAKWCQDYDRILYRELVRNIKNRCENFNLNQFIDMNDFYHYKRDDLNQLSALGYQDSTYPRDCYEFSALVLSCLFNHHPQKNLSDWLSILSYYHENNPSYHRDYQHKILLACLNIPNQIDMKILICLHLILHFQYDIQSLKKLSIEKSFDIMEGPFQSPFALSCFLQFFKEEEKKRKVLSLKIKKHYPPLEEFCVRHPEFLMPILETLSAESIILWLTKTLHQDLKLWFQISLEQGYAIIQKKCTLEQKQCLWQLKTSDGQSIFDFNLHQPKVIQTLLDDIFTHDYLYGDYFDISGIQALLFKALKHPASFNLLFDAIIDDQMAYILSMNDEHHLIEYIIPIPEILMHILMELDETDLAFIFQIYANEMIMEHAHQRDVLEFIFQLMPSPLLFDVLEYPLHNNQRIIEVLLHHHQDILPDILSNLNHSHRQKLLFSNDKALLNQLSKAKSKELMKSFDYLTGHELIKLLDSDVFFHMVLSDEDTLYAYLENLSTKEIKVFLMHQNSNGQNWLSAAPIHHQTLDIILSSSPCPHQLIHHALICKIINQPECLKVILHYIPFEERGEWVLSLQKIHLQNLINLESLIYLLTKTPLIHQRDLLLMKHQRHHSIYQWLLYEFTGLLKIMPHLSQESITLINHKIIQNKQELQNFEKNPDKIKLLFEHFNAEQRFHFLLGLCQEFRESHIPPGIKIEIMKFAISSLEHINSLSPKQFTHEQKKNPMWYQIKHASLFKECIEPLLTRGEELHLDKHQHIAY